MRRGGATKKELLLIASDRLRVHKGSGGLSQHNDLSRPKNQRSVTRRTKIELNHPGASFLIFGQALPQQFVVAVLGPGFKIFPVDTHAQ